MVSGKRPCIFSLGRAASAFDAALYCGGEWYDLGGEERALDLGAIATCHHRLATPLYMFLVPVGHVGAYGGVLELEAYHRN